MARSGILRPCIYDMVSVCQNSWFLRFMPRRRRSSSGASRLFCLPSGPVACFPLSSIDFSAAATDSLQRHFVELYRAVNSPGPWVTDSIGARGFICACQSKHDRQWPPCAPSSERRMRALASIVWVCVRGVFVKCDSIFSLCVCVVEMC